MKSRILLIAFHAGMLWEKMRDAICRPKSVSLSEWRQGMMLVEREIASEIEAKRLDKKLSA